jgi:hypothetical protein
VQPVVVALDVGRRQLKMSSEVCWATLPDHRDLDRKGKRTANVVGNVLGLSFPSSPTTMKIFFSS